MCFEQDCDGIALNGARCVKSVCACRLPCSWLRVMVVRGGGARNSAKLKTAVVPRAMELRAATTVLSLQGV